MSDYEEDDMIADDYESDFIDDDDDDEDYDEDYGAKKSSKRKPLKNLKTKKKQKKARLTGRDFIQAEAEEDSQEDENSEEEMGEEEKRYLAEQRKQMSEQLKRRTTGPGFLNYEGEELEDYLKTAAAREEAGEGDELALLPTPADPKIFAVKTKPKEERDACNQIMKRYFECLGTDAEFQIFSCTAIDKTEGYIYIEAYSDKHVYMATANIPNIFANKVTLVPLAERPQLYESDLTKGVKVKIGQWVRITKGLYQNDLAQVEDVDDVKEKVLVKLVPRIAPENEEEQQEEKKDRFAHLRKAKTTNGVRPPQKLFQESEYSHNISNSRDTERGINFTMYQNNRYYDGLLYKWFPVKNLSTQNINVTYEESKFFTIGEHTDPTVLNTLIDQASAKATKFFKGDKVKVIRGDLVNLEAEILKIGLGSLTVKPVNTEFVEAVDILPTDCVKSFVKGDYVRVVEGKNAGKEGFVISVEDNIASIMADGLQNMIQVFVNDLVFCNESTRNIEVKNTKDKELEQEYNKFDLVKLNDKKTVGIVLGTANTGWKILDNFGVVRNISPYQIEQKLNTRNNLTRNDKNQTFRIGDSIRILQGKYKGQTGTIRHIYNDLLFIYNPDVPTNMGIVIEKANNAFLLSSQRQQNGKPVGPKGKDTLIGQKCAIKSGPWKGYQGIVKDGNERTVRLELTSKCQIIDVKRELVIPVSDIGKSTGPAEPRMTEAKTPMINRFPQSPMFGLNSPGFESSPAWNGFESPAYDSHI